MYEIRFLNGLENNKKGLYIVKNRNIKPQINRVKKMKKMDFYLWSKKRKDISVDILEVKWYNTKMKQFCFKESRAFCGEWRKA